MGCKDARVKRLIGIGAPVNSSDFSYLDSCEKPKLFVHGEKDEFGDAFRLLKLVERLPGEKELVVVAGVDHFFKGRVEELGEAIREWMNGWPGD